MPARPGGITAAIATALLVVSLVCPSAAPAVQRAPDQGFDLYDWVLLEGTDFSGPRGAWVNLTGAVDAVEHPFGDTGSTCDPADAQHADIPSAVDALVSRATTELARGEFDSATASFAGIAHLLTDAQDPCFGIAVPASDAGHAWFDAWVQRYLGAAWADHGWVPERPVRCLTDIQAEVRALQAMAAGHRSDALRFGKMEASGTAPPLLARQQLALRVVTAATLLGDIAATVSARSQRDVVPVESWAGATRYETAVAASRATFADGSDAVVVASGERWPDALSASSLCGAERAPLLLVGGTGLPGSVSTEIARLGASRVIVVGGAAAVSESVLSAIDAIPGIVQVTRVAGADRYETSFAVAALVRNKQGAGWSRAAYVCTGDGFADALSVSAFAAKDCVPVVLAPRTGPQVLAARLSAAGVASATIVGGTGAVPSSVEAALRSTLGSASVRRVAGATRYSTSAAVFGAGTLGPNALLAAASGTDFPDGLTAGVAAGLSGGGLVLVSPGGAEDAVSGAVGARRDAVASLALAGGSGVLSAFTRSDLQRALDPSAASPPSYEEWVPPVRAWYSHAMDVTSNAPTHGYMDGRIVIDRVKDFPRDRNGILMISYAGAPPVYNPQTISNYALACYESYLHSGNGAHFQEFVKHAAWLRDTGMDSSGRLVYRFSIPSRGLRAPWYSCISQGGAIMTFTRAWTATGDDSYLAAARRAYVPYTRELAQGGVAHTINGELWLEEYPDAHQVLNGMIFGMWGLWDLWRVTGDDDVKETFDRCADTLRRHLGDYESGGRVLYERVPGRWAGGYHEVHIIQLRVLSDLTGDMAFANRADRWWLLPIGANGSSLGGLDDPTLAVGFDPSGYLP